MLLILQKYWRGLYFLFWVHGRAAIIKNQNPNSHKNLNTPAEIFANKNQNHSKKSQGRRAITRAVAARGRALARAGARWRLHTATEFRGICTQINEELGGSFDAPVEPLVLGSTAGCSRGSTTARRLQQVDV